MNHAYDAILLLGFGGPTRPEEVRPFLEKLVSGLPIPPARLDEVQRHYAAMGGRSPYNDLTMKQAAALRQRLAREDRDIPVYVAMRNWAPYVADVMRQVAAAGTRRVFCLVLAPHRCDASWDRYQRSVTEALAGLGPDAPIVDYPQPWHDHPLFVRAMAARVGDALERLGTADRPQAHLIFTAHSIPLAMDAHSGYSQQVMDSCRLVARELGLDRWSIAYQSRSGSPREPWLEPDVGQALREVSAEAVVIAPIGFICDHVEVLYDLDVEAAAVARRAGIRMARAATVADHPLFIEMILSALMQRAEQQTELRPSR